MTEPTIKRNACGNCAHLLKLEPQDTSGMCTHEQSSQGLVFVGYHCDLYESEPECEAIKVCLNCKWFHQKATKPLDKDGNYVMFGFCQHPDAHYSIDKRQVDATDSCESHEEKSHEGR